MLTAVFALLRGVPIWVWAIAAALAWGGVQHHRAQSAGETLRQAQEAAAAEEAQALRAVIDETNRRALRHEEIASAARAQAQAHARTAAAARAAAGRVRDAAAAAYAASAAASGAAAAGDCSPAEGASNLLADLLGRTAARAAELADLADRARAAGLACERSYDALTPNAETIPGHAENSDRDVSERYRKNH